MLVRLFSATLAVLVAFSGASAQETANDPDGGATDSRNDEYADVRQTVLERVNQFRDEEELSAVKPDETLQKAAAEFAGFMARTGKYGHRADDRTPAERATAAGYDYCIVLENIAYRSGRLDAVELGEHFFEGWKESPEHRHNMLNADVTQMGVGLATAEDGRTVFAVQLFGRPESEQIEISIVNRSGGEVKLAVEEDSGGRTFQLPPRGVIMLTRCGVTVLKLPEADVVRKVTESTRMTITEGDEGLRLEQEDE